MLKEMIIRTPFHSKKKLIKNFSCGNYDDKNGEKILKIRLLPKYPHGKWGIEAGNRKKNVIALEFRWKCRPFFTDIHPQMNSPSFPLWLYQTLNFKFHPDLLPRNLESEEPSIDQALPLTCSSSLSKSVLSEFFHLQPV